MARLENFVPVLKKGRVVESGTNFIRYELEHGEVVDIPVGEHLLSLFKMMNGSYSFGDMIRALFAKERQPILVGTLLNFISTLSNKNLFSNNEKLVEAVRQFLEGKAYRSAQNVVTTDNVNKKYFSVERLMMLLKKTALNAKNDEEILKRIIKASEVKLSKMGEMLIQEGEIETTLFVLLTGELGVYSRSDVKSPWEFISRITPVSVFGESSAVFGKPRTATVMPTMDSWVLEVPFGELVNTKKEETMSDFKSLRTRIVLNQILQTAPMFSGLPSDVMEQFIGKCELIQVNAGVDVVFQRTEGREGSDVMLEVSSFYFIVGGSVEVIKNGETLGELTQGDYFGEVGALNKMGRTATCRAKSDCKLLTLSAASLNSIFSNNFSLALQIEKKAEERISEALGLNDDDENLSPVHFNVEEDTFQDFDMNDLSEFTNSDS